MAEHSKRKHSIFAPSSAERWMNCAGSVELLKKVPPQAESPYAIEGTKAHECLEFIVQRFSNRVKAENEALKKWDAEMVDHCIDAAEEVFSLKPSKKAKLLTEIRVSLKHIDKALHGTLDYAWVDEWGSLVVIDFKYGAGVIVNPCNDEGKENPQLFFYAAGLAHKHQYEFCDVKLAIIQPRAFNPDGEITKCHTTTIKKLRAFEKEIATALKAARNPKAVLTPSEDACRWCAAKSICPAISSTAMTSADIVFDVESGITSHPDPLSLTAETLPVILTACDHLDIWIKEVREHAFNLAQKGVKIVGRKLVDKRGIRHWMPEAEKKAEQTFGEYAFETSLLSPAQLEKRLGKDAKEFTEKYTTIVSSGYTLVSESDKRQEVSHSVFDIDKA